MRLGDDNTIRSTGGTGSIENSFTPPLAMVRRMVSDFFEVVVVAT